MDHFPDLDGAALVPRYVPVDLQPIREFRGGDAEDGVRWQLRRVDRREAVAVDAPHGEKDPRGGHDLPSQIVDVDGGQRGGELL